MRHESATDRGANEPPSRAFPPQCFEAHFTPATSRTRSPTRPLLAHNCHPQVLSCERTRAFSPSGMLPCSPARL